MLWVLHRIGVVAVKYGARKPSISRSVKARTTGKIKRSVKSSINPLYGKKGMGLINDPKKSLYNKVYSKTTFGVSDVSGGSGTTDVFRSSENPYTSSKSIKSLYAEKRTLEEKIRDLNGTTDSLNIYISVTITIVVLIMTAITIGITAIIGNAATGMWVVPILVSIWPIRLFIKRHNVTKEVAALRIRLIAIEGEIESTEKEID